MWNSIQDFVWGEPRLTLAQMSEMGLLPFLQPQSINLTPTGRTPFTKGSYKAWSAIITNSILHNASAPLFFMQFEKAKKHPLNSMPALLVIWAIAATLNGWMNYYQNINRLTEEYGLAFEPATLKPKMPGTLYIFHTVNEQDEREPHYKIFIENAKKELVEEIVSLKTLGLTADLLEKLQQGRFNNLTTQDSIDLKAAIATHYPHHKPVLHADEFAPGDRSDAWFVPMCVLSESPTAFSGAILGYTGTVGLSESVRYGIALLFAIMNWVKNILTDMPTAAAAYGTDRNRRNMGPIIEQLGAWLVLNPVVIGLLKYVAPLLLAAFTSYGIATAASIPFPYNGLLALILFPFVVSTFFLFTMYALQKLNVDSKHPVSAMLNLKHPLAIEAKTWCDMILAMPGELVAWRALTISGPLKLGKFLGLSTLNSEKLTAIFLTAMYVISNLALIYDPTAEVAQTFLTFFFEDSANVALSYVIYAALFLEAFAAIMSARSKEANFRACVDIRAQELGIENNPNDTTSVVVCFAKSTSTELSGPFVSSNGSATTQMTAQDFISGCLEIHSDSQAYPIGVTISYCTLYGEPAMAGAQATHPSTPPRSPRSTELV